MPGKTKRELEKENSVLKEELSELRSKMSYFPENCECVKNQSGKNQMQNKKSFKCNMCDVTFEKQVDFKKHKDNHKLNDEMYHCDDCGKVFNEEWKLNAHKKRHENFKCNQCSKTFKNQDIMEKHAKISHGNLKIYCHFFNNKKSCPYEQECIFIHEDAGFCRYSVLCERNYCMYKHDDEPDETEECGNKTFQNPSQFEQNISDEKFQCDWCDFNSERKSDLDKHQELSKAWCTVCSESWGCEDNLKSHLEISHGRQSKE